MTDRETLTIYARPTREEIFAWASTALRNMPDGGIDVGVLNALVADFASALPKLAAPESAESRWIADTADACPRCGGSGHKDDAAPAPVPADVEGLVDLIGEFGRATFNLLDSTEESGPVGESVLTVWKPDFDAAAAVLEKIEELPFEEPGVILGTGAKLQAAIKQTFATALRAQAARIAALEAERDRLREARTWPDWRTADPDKAIEHVRASGDGEGA